MKFYKYKSSLYFEKDSDNILRYDFTNNHYYKITNGRKEREIADPRPFFRNMSFNSVFDDCEDEKYKKFIKTISYKKHNCSNIGTFLSSLRYFQNLEHWILLDIDVDNDINFKPNDLPKDIIKIIKDCKIRLNRYDEGKWTDPNFINCVRYVYKERGEKDLRSLLSFYTRYDIDILRDTYKYEYKRLIDYIFYVKDFEGYGYNLIRNLKDYARMQSSMCLKYNKYPKFLKSIHDIVVLNYNVFKEEHNQEIFSKMINKELSYTGREFSMVVPEKTDDIKNEGVQLHHCVASYINKIIEGETQIVFIRKNNKLDDSLITVEIRNNKIIQASGEYNRKLNEKELTFLERYCIVKKIEMNKKLY